MSILILIGSIIFLLILITIFKLNAFLALCITSLAVGIAKGMPLVSLIESFQKGMGNTLGGIVLVMGVGIMLGSLLAESGATQQISNRLISLFGVQRAKWAMVITGFVVGIAMFYNAGFVILIPLAFSIAASSGLPLIYLSIAMAASLSVTHGFLPPHPGPTAIAVLFKADIGKTLLYGIVVAIPALIAGGLIFPEFIKKIKANPPVGLVEVKNFDEKKLPSFPLSITVALTPVLLMAISTMGAFVLHKDSWQFSLIKFIGDPGISMLIAFLLAIVLLGTNRGMDMKYIMDKTSAGVAAGAMLFLIIGGGGAFKQVLQDSGIGESIAQAFKSMPLSPLVLGWLVATVIRISIGSATVAGITAAGIVQPILATSGVSPELMILAIGAGSLMCSHVNDTGFWMFKEYLGLSIPDTFKTWTLLETIVGICGLIGVLILDIFV
jgi:gluconate transporter